MAQKFKGVLLLALGVALLWFGISQYLAGRAYTGGRAPGTVISLRENRDTSETSKGRKLHITFSPVVRYTSAEGQTREFTSHHGSSPPEYSVGQTVPVTYNPSDPTKVEIDGFMERGFIEVVSGGLGLVLCILGIIILFRHPNTTR